MASASTAFACPNTKVRTLVSPGCKVMALWRLSALENNKPGCGIRDLAKLEMIAGYLNIPLRYLLFGEGEDIEKEDDFI